MKKSNLQFNARKARIYKDIYRPSSNLSRFLGTILSVILQGQSPVSSPDYYHTRKTK